MQLVVFTIAGLVFLALLILDPVAVAQLGYFCATGNCGVRSRWLALALALLVILWLALRAHAAWRRRMAAAKAKTKRKPRKSRAKPRQP